MQTRPTILVINPNTSEAVTEVVRGAAQAEAGEHAAIVTATASFGARYISSVATAAIAGHAVLDAYARALAEGITPDAAIIGCFGDPGIDALREVSPAPVFGFAESGLLLAARQPGRFIVATIGLAWTGMLADLVHKLELGDRVAGILALENVRDDPTSSARTIAEAAQRTGATRAVIGGAGLIPALPAITSQLDLPVIDPHRGAIRRAITETTTPTLPMRECAPALTGLSGPLNALLG